MATIVFHHAVINFYIIRAQKIRIWLTEFDTENQSLPKSAVITTKNDTLPHTLNNMTDRLRMRNIAALPAFFLSRRQNRGEEDRIVFVRLSFMNFSSYSFIHLQEILHY